MSSSYKVGLVYKIITFESNDIYIGSTFDELRFRFRAHKDNYKIFKKGKCNYCSIYDMFDKYGINKCKIILIKEYKVVDRRHLEMYEQLWINKLNPINKNCAFQLLRKEKRKLYRENNKGLIKQKNKEYRENNKDKINGKKKEYNENNKVKIREKQKQYRETNKDKVREKNKQYYETNKEKKKHYSKLYYQTNKDKIREEKKEYYQTNKDKIREERKETVKCELCSKTVRKDSLSRHIKNIHK